MCVECRVWWSVVECSVCMECGVRSEECGV